MFRSVLFRPRRTLNTVPPERVGVTSGTCTHLAGATNQRTTTCAMVTFDLQIFSEEMEPLTGLTPA